MTRVLNDEHSRLNETTVERVERPRDAAEVVSAIGLAREEGLPVIACGQRHSMGGQQFVKNGVVIDTAHLTHVGEVDRDARTVRVGAGICWPELINALHAQQHDADEVLSIRQKQTGADTLTMGGAVASNIHSRGLNLKPFINDVESLRMVRPDGELIECSRDENAELFSLAFGGYGLFGVITDITMRLDPRVEIVREVIECPTADVIDTLHARRDEGYMFGDWQYDIDDSRDLLLTRGIMSCYRPLAEGEDAPEGHGRIQMSRDKWIDLMRLAEQDKGLAYKFYRNFYLSSTGQKYHSDTHQLAVYLDGYADMLTIARNSPAPLTLMIGEQYVPRDRFVEFAERSREVIAETGTEVLYGTVRLIERDDESFLNWAREPWACTIFNITVEHTPEGLARAQAGFRGLNDVCIEMGGSFFPTYHLWASADQLRAAHPRIDEFVAKKHEFDPDGIFSSVWFENLQQLLSE